MKNNQKLIDYEQAIRATYEEIFWTESEQAVVRHFLAKLPKIDAVEVEHGRWEEAGFDGHGDYKECCSNCKSWSIGDDKLYCPVCGAKMDE